MLKLIQLGLSFTDGEGNWANGCTCWQFNFKFSLTYVRLYHNLEPFKFPPYVLLLFDCIFFSDDMFAQDSIELLKTSGIDFVKFEEFGIDVQYFGELMMMSGLILTDDVKWISFHSGYDFGYLMKTLTCVELPPEENLFMEMLHLYFPCIYDVKVRNLIPIYTLYITLHCNNAAAAAVLLILQSDALALPPSPPSPPLPPRHSSH